LGCRLADLDLTIKCLAYCGGHIDNALAVNHLATTLALRECEAEDGS
jgi:hypothetical protein